MNTLNKCSAVTVLMLLGFAIASAQIASAQTILRVDDDSQATSPDGSSWQDAFQYLQDALFEAQDILNGPQPPLSVQIWVAEGIYRPDQSAANPSGTGDPEATFNLIRSVEILGGFAGIGAPDPDDRDPETYITILSGDLDNNDQFSTSHDMYGQLESLTFGNYADNSHHVVTAKSFNFALAEFPPGAATCDATCPEYVDGGAYLHCSPTGEFWCNCDAGCWDFGDCCPDICTSGCAPSMCAEIVDSTAVLDGFTIRGGSAPDAAYDHDTFDGYNYSVNSYNKGGGILIVNSSPRIQNCIIEQNRSIGISNDESAGGVYVFFEGWPAVPPNIVRIEGCTIRHNSAYNGGGIHVGNFNLCGEVGETPIELYRDLQRTVLIDCTIRENRASAVGGGVYASDDSMLDIVNTTVIRNITGVPKNEGQLETDGAGVYAKSGAIRLWNCVIARNVNHSIQDGAAGGLSIISWWDAEVLNCTIADNRVYFDPLCDTTTPIGVGVRVFDGSPSSSPIVPVKNTIVWGNTSCLHCFTANCDEAFSSVQINDSPSFVDVEFSNIEGGWPGTGNIGDDPEDPANNPFFLFPSMDNYDIAWNSGCKDAGKNNFLPADIYDLNLNANFTENVPFDRAFRDREFDETVGVGGIVDIGAFERHAGPVSCPIDLDGNYSVNVLDLLVVLSGWGDCPTPPTECPGDLNDDDSVDVLDLLMVLNAWGHCEVGGGAGEPVPQTVEDCMERYDPGTTELETCLEWVAEQDQYLNNEG